MPQAPQLSGLVSRSTQLPPHKVSSGAQGAQEPSEHATPCREIDALFHEYLSGETLTEEQTALIEAHLESCASCRADLVEWFRLDRTIHETAWERASKAVRLPLPRRRWTLLRVAAALFVSISVGLLAWSFLTPDAAAPRVTPGPPAPAELARLLAEASINGEPWSHRRTAARSAYEAAHRPSEVAEQMIEVLGEVSCGL